MIQEFVDSESILLKNEQWMRLEKEWGEPVDLDDEDFSRSNLKPIFSSLDLRTTFDSATLLNKFKNKLKRQRSNSFYGDFVRDLPADTCCVSLKKQFYFVNGEIFSADSVDDVCRRIDEVFKSVEILSCATSTIRRNSPKKFKIPSNVQCSISTEGLSFDETTRSFDMSDENIDRFIDDVFLIYDTTIESEQEIQSDEKFTNSFSGNNFMKNSEPSPKDVCNKKFRELSEFWRKLSSE